jgi:hypothetical protein
MEIEIIPSAETHIVYTGPLGSCNCRDDRSEMSSFGGRHGQNSGCRLGGRLACVSLLLGLDGGPVVDEPPNWLGCPRSLRETRH